MYEQEENGEQETSKYLHSCYYLIIYRILLILKFKNKSYKKYCFRIRR